MVLSQFETNQGLTGLTALYCRVSTDEQAREGISLQEQQERLRAYCRAMGIRGEIRLFVDDGYSAKSMERPELKRLLEIVKAGAVSKIMVTKLDRMSRKLLDLLNLIDLLHEYGVSFASISESFDTHTPAGRLTLQVLGAVAEFERERIRERVFENMLHAAGTGKWLTQSPYGYNLQDKMLVINVQEAAVVRRIFDFYLHHGWGYFSIAKILNEEGIPSRQRKEWSVRAIKLLLSNPVYKGTLVWNRLDSSKAKRKTKDPEEWVVVEDCLPAIIERDKWEQVRKRMSTVQIAPRAANSPHLLGGLLRCGNCGSGMSIGFSGSVKKRYRVYRCSANKNKGVCTAKQYRADDVEQSFKEGLASLLRTRQEGSKIVVSINDSRLQRKASMEVKAKHAALRYKRKVEAFAAGLIELVDLKREKESLDLLQSERANLEVKTIPLSEMNSNELQQELNRQIPDLVGAIEILPVVKAKSILRTMISGVSIREDEMVISFCL